MQSSCTINQENFIIKIENDLLFLIGSISYYQFQINLNLQIDWLADFSGFTICSINVILSEQNGIQIFNKLASRVINCNYQRFFENVTLIDKGGQSMGVYDSIRLIDNQWFATKILRKNYGIPLEIKLLNRFSHENIVKPRYFFMDDINYYIVFEKLQKLKKPKHEIQLQNQFKQILKAVEYIHEQGYIHRDIKPKNIMQNKNSQVQLIDLGLVVKQSKSVLKQSGTPGYIAPEIFKGPHYNQKADMFSLGAVFYELYFNQPLIPQHNVRLRNSFLNQKITLSLELVTQLTISYQDIQLKTLTLGLISNNHQIMATLIKRMGLNQQDKYLQNYYLLQMEPQNLPEWKNIMIYLYLNLFQDLNNSYLRQRIEQINQRK